MKPRFSVRMILAAVASIAGILAVFRWNDPAVRYRRDRDQASLHAVLSRRVADGDSIEAVELILGRGVVNSDPKLHRAAAKMASLNRKGWPQGVRQGDVFLRYQSGPGFEEILQFRLGRLVNFDPCEFAGPAVPFMGTSR